MPRTLASTFFSATPPIAIDPTNISDVKSLLIPSHNTFDALSKHISSTETELPCAAICAHLPDGHPARYTAFPMWIIEYWLEISRFCQHVILPWLQAESWTNNVSSSLRCTDKHMLLNNVHSIFCSLSWTGTTYAFSDSEPIFSLAAILSSK
jgi:hypothetical protein